MMEEGWTGLGWERRFAGEAYRVPNDGRDTSKSGRGLRALQDSKTLSRLIESVGEAWLCFSADAVARCRYCWFLFTVGQHYAHETSCGMGSDSALPGASFNCHAAV